MEKDSKNIKFVLHETKDTHTSKFDQTAECDGREKMMGKTLWQRNPN